MRKEYTAGGIVLGDHGTIAMVRVRNGDGAWLFPKGHIEEGEDGETAARREIAEEVGLTNLEYLDDLGSYTRPKIHADGTEDPELMKEIRMFLFAAEPHASLLPTHEASEAAWVSLPRVIETIGHTKDRAWFTTVFERVRHAIQRD